MTSSIFTHLFGTRNAKNTNSKNLNSFAAHALTERAQNCLKGGDGEEEEIIIEEMIGG